MDILFVADPLAGFTLYKDSTYAMMAEAARRGHGLWACEPEDLAWRGGRVAGRVRDVRLHAQARQGDWCAAGAAAWRDLADFGAVLMRKDPPFDEAYLNATYLLEMAERDGARIFNRPGALRDYNEKLAIARYPQFIVASLVSSRPDEIRAFLAEQGDIVVKPLNAMGGSGIFRLRPGDANLGAILETATGLGRRQVMAQRYIPEIAAGDKRILLIAGVPVPYALARIPAPGETRGNLAAGGTGVAQPLSERDRAIAAALGPALAADGLLLVGLDVIGDWLTEINVTSPTCFREITAQTGCDVAALFVDALERQVAA
ncbi:glutathione synthase [Parasulfuritortus cantonensis]|uniref:Glutathione synthetase n=1 Tax=Parasulfuritortus cantonensis TaxID=2528202 RepID=A0A4R1B8X8_9PROT|nr:glutathione synthase [Parasulfuritortus cantonensis]TCJ12893.1 glutathione synthase [Parasulfuritortus cantonensis]